MPRPPCCRRIEHEPGVRLFKPAGVPLRALEEITLGEDELEALRLADLEGLYQEAAAERMNVSRATFGRVIASARHKVAEALVGGKSLRVEGGSVEVFDARLFQCATCGNRWHEPRGTGQPKECPTCRNAQIRRADEKDTDGDCRGHRHGGHGRRGAS